MTLPSITAKQSQIEALRGGALSGIATRQATLHARRIKAVEQLWDTVISLAPAKNVSAWIAVVKFENAFKEAARNPKLRQIFEIMGKGYEEQYKQSAEAAKARPFLSPLAWAYYSAYSAIVFHTIIKLKMLQNGLDKPDLVDPDGVNKLVKVALPHRTEYIQKYGASAYHYLLDELESLLLIELGNILQGAESDRESIEQAARILQEAERLAVANAEQQNEELNKRVYLDHKS